MSEFPTYCTDEEFIDDDRGYSVLSEFAGLASAALMP